MIRPENFRQPGDTHLQRLQRFLDALGGGTDGELDADYVIPSQLVLSGKSNFRLRGNGHRIRVADGAPTGWGGSALYIVQCNDFEISDLHCDGNRESRIPAEDPAHVIVVDKCHRWLFRNVHVVNGTCDGFLVYAGTDGNGTGPGGAVSTLDFPSRWKLKDCTALNNFRQGLSIIEGVDASIEGGRYGLTRGLWDTGNGPCAGIILEPDDVPSRPANRIRNIRLQNILFDGNQGAGLAITRVNGVRNIEVVDCIFDANKKAAIESFGDEIAILRPTVRNWTNEPYSSRASAPPKRGAIDIGYLAGPTSIADPKFELIDNGASDHHPCIYVHGAAAAGIAISGIRSDGSASFICGAHAPRVQVSHSVVDLRSSVRPDAFVFLGDHAVFEHMMLLGVYERAAYFGGKAPQIKENKFYVRISRPTTHIVGAWDAIAPELRGNLVEFEQPVASKAFSVGQDATVVDNKIVNSLSDRLFDFSGPPRASTGNSRVVRRARESPSAQAP
ncbi:hypothetical protein K5P26_02890 [Sphingopyxis sp. XHP0097]|uniref:Right handed beta helix domain-containing protein n=1 Tax=Sphingopyxis jiangsuensis TaxID=2871171 RepID=A0ABS7MAN7_9SPHN|nr:MULTISPECIES: hypothetical protein [Sphingopyxis]MBY4636083.1 hypothetical protein [Sphingopyxis jiangsuensis]